MLIETLTAIILSCQIPDPYHKQNECIKETIRCVINAPFLSSEPAALTKCILERE